MIVVALFVSALLATANATTWTIVKGVNAIPTGINPPIVASLAACEAKAEGHSQFTFNLQSGHCYVGDGTTFGGAALDHVTSGCDATKVKKGCEAPKPTPPPAPTPAPRAFDGTVRKQADGTEVAYLIPPYLSNHASTIEQLPDGTLAVAWFSGVKEEADRCAIVFSTLP